MTDSTPAKMEDTLESRVASIETALKLDDRLSSLEKTLRDKGYIANSPIAWWRNGKTVTILAALIAAVVPLMTAIDGSLKNSREYQRLLVDQQDRIRQVYLDRVLKPGITEVERQKIFNLLIKLKSDPELQGWATEERDKVTQNIEELRKEKENLEQSYLRATQELAEAKSSQGGEAHARVLGLTTQAANDKRRIDSIRQRIGESSNPSANVDLPVFNEFEISKSASGRFLIQDAGKRIRLIPNEPNLDLNIDVDYSFGIGGPGTTKPFLKTLKIRNSYGQLIYTSENVSAGKEIKLNLGEYKINLTITNIDYQEMPGYMVWVSFNWTR